MFKATNVATSLLAALGLGFGKQSPAQAIGPSLKLPSLVKDHTNPKRNQQRKLCRTLGHRQARRMTRASYLLRDGATIG